MCVASPAFAAKAKHKPKPPPEPPLAAILGPYVVADVATGRVIEEYDALRPWFPASTTKLMTTYVTFEAIRAGELTLDSRVLYSANAANQPASKMGFKPGTTLSLDDALKMMMVKSANDIAVAVAETVGGSVAGFATRMNATAKRLGMTRSHFANPNGLPDENNYTTARDMALVGRAILTEFPQYRHYFNLHAIEIGGRVLKTFNSLVERYPGTTGMKTGFICASGYNVVASAKRGEREVIAVVFGQYGAKARTERAAKLLDDGFGSQPPAPDAAFVTLADAKSGESYHEPMDMRPYVCGPRRVRVASAANEEGDDDEGPTTRLTDTPINLGPPIKVSALVPPDVSQATADSKVGDDSKVSVDTKVGVDTKVSETGPAARLPRPRPGAEPPGPAVLNAYAPGEDGASAPAEAIGAAAGSAHPLDEVAPR